MTNSKNEIVLKVVCLFDTGSRFPLIMAEGLLNHPNVDVCFNKTVRSLGMVLASATPSVSLGYALLNSDLIFIPDLDHFGEIQLLEFIEKAGLWSKVVVYDFKDSPKLERGLYERCLAYFKRSYYSGLDRQKTVDDKFPAFPLNYCLLDCYLEIAPKDQSEKTIDLGYFFNPADVVADKRRGNVLQYLNHEDWSPYYTMIGKTTTSGTAGRRSVLSSIKGNAWVDYMELLGQTKILFSAFPEEWDGDSRTWEAMSSKALCFLDKTYFSTEHYFEHGKHCFFYDASDKASIRDAICLAKEYLKPERKAERESIAEEGFKHAICYHRSVNRIDYMLRSIQSKLASI